MKILIIENNTNTADYLRDALRENGYIATVAHDGQEGLNLALNNDYDLIIYDVMMPNIDAHTFLDQLRERNNTLPVLILTARGISDKRTKGVELGGDDYLEKPFSFVELLARIRTLLRQTEFKDAHIIKVADLTLDAMKHTATRYKKRIDLTADEFILLTFLASRTGETLSRALITKQVWNNNFESGANVIDAAMKQLSDKVDSKYKVKLIHSVRGGGYTLEER
tara:strand:+ start:806 stop:1477 length:672 start_codon:yes stop_codon:yes gene_type:complete